jgi:4-hydroxybenzoate polyprenyltransferase
MNWNHYARLYDTLLTEHTVAFTVFIVTGGTLAVMLLQGLVGGVLYVGLLPLFVIPAYCLYRMWRGVRESAKETIA